MNQSQRWAKPVPLELFSDEFLRRNGATFTPEPDRFVGTWEEKYWKNIPGPFYSTTENLMSLVASSEAPGHLFHDDHCEFVWKQPQSDREYAACITGMYCDEADSYALDGDQHWTPQLVAEWWSRCPELVDWVKGYLLEERPSGHRVWGRSVNVPDSEYLSQYLGFLENGVEEYLRSYIFLLLEGRAARPTEALPSIQ